MLGRVFHRIRIVRCRLEIGVLYHFIINESSESCMGLCIFTCPYSLPNRSFDPILDHFFCSTNQFRLHFLPPIFSALKFFCPQILLPSNSSATKFFCHQILLPPNFSATKFFCPQFFLPSNFSALNFFCPQIFLPSNFSALKFFCHQIFLPKSPHFNELTR